MMTMTKTAPILTKPILTKQSWILILVSAIFAVLAPGQSWATTSVIFGPQQYTRTTGAPNQYSNTFTLPAGIIAPFQMHIQNGNATGGNRVSSGTSSATVTLNGVQVAGPSDFDQTVAVVDRTVTVNAQNTLQVSMASAPGSILIITIRGVVGDLIAPAIAIVAPPPGGAINTATPHIEITYQDPASSGGVPGSGVDTNTLSVLLDGVDRTSLFIRRPGDASADIPSSLALTAGLHTIQASIKDFAGNLGQTSGQFTVDLTPPQIQILQPVSGSYIATQTPVITLQYSDNNQIDQGSLQVLINGQDQTNLFSKTATGAVATLTVSSALPSGANQIVAQIKDVAGNSATASAAFNVDIQPPVITIAHPAAGSLHGTAQIDVSILYSDDQALDLTTLQAAIDGVNIPLSAAATGATGTSAALADGAHTFTASIKDKAGNQATATASFSVDTTAPDIHILQPAAGAFLNSATPTIVVDYSDSQGVDPATLQVTVNGVDRTSLFVRGATSATATLTGVAALPDGSVTVTAQISDQTGNTGHTTTSFTVDTTPPLLSVQSPGPLVNTKTPAITLSYSDATSGIDLRTLRVTVDGIDQTASLAIGQSSATGVLNFTPALTEGAHQLAAVISDKAGNTTQISATFVVDTIAPLVTIASPADNAFLNTATPGVQITYTDGAGAGVDASSVHVVLLHGADPPIDITSSLLVDAQHAAGAIPATAALADNTYQLRVTLQDLAGNPATAQATFEIDTVAPTYNIQSPALNSFQGATPPITITYSDFGSGIDPAQVKVLVDGIDITSSLTVTATDASGTLPAANALPDGAHTIQVTVADRAGNVAPVVPQVFTVDTLPPTITPVIAPPPNAAGWNNTDVTVSFVCTDAGSGVAICPAPVVVTTEGAGQVFTVTATDNLGSVATTAVTLNIDKTPPIITAVALPAANAVGIVTAPATISFTCADALSGIAVCPPPITVTTAGANQSFTGSATDVAGNSASASVTLTVQSAPLAVAAVLSPQANAAGWNNSDVTVSFICTGGVPPVVCPGPQTVTLEGAHQIINATTTDAAGQSANTSVTLNIDKTPPTISADISPVPNNSGVIIAPSVTINFTCADTLSGVATCAPPVTVTTSGVQTITGAAADAAGNTATTSFQINVQTNPPLTIKATVSPTPNAAGWNNTPVTVSFQCDGGVPPVTCPASIPVSTDGANQVFSGTATDASGATASANATVNLDQTPPLLTITSPADGSVSPTVNVAVTGLVSESGSGLASITCNGAAASFSATDFNCSAQTTNGTLLLSVQAVDVAGNTSTVSATATLKGPALTITSPAPLALFASNSITVTGTVDDPNAIVSVNGVQATIDGANFTAQGVILREGSSVVTATGTNTGGAKGTASVNVVLDTVPPIVTIDSPSDGVVVTSPQIYVTGMVNDVVPGTVNSAQVSVTVNGVQADVANRTFMAEDILLVPGKNIITAVAKDRAGNVSQNQITVTLLDAAAQQRLLMVSGNGQVAPAQTTLPAPLVVQAINGLGQPIANLPITYTVNKSDGQLAAFPQQGRQITVQTDADGKASVNFQLGTRIGKGNNQVLVSSPGFIGEVMFCSTATVGTPVQIHDIAGEGQTGVTGQPIPEPMVVVVFDAGGNAVSGVPVIFKVEQGGGTLEGGSAVTKVTDSDGRASATLVLAQEEGVNNNVVSASFDGLTGSKAVFIASGATPKDAANTTVTGIVLDSGNSPVVNATASIQGTNLTALTDQSGRFTIANAPVGSINLFIDGSTSNAAEPYPFLEFPLVTVAGQDNHLPSPIFLPELDFDNSKIVGGDEDVTLNMKGVPGVQFTVFAHSATFPDGSKVGRLSVSQVHSDQVPMPPPNATAPHLFWTVQPPRVKFDPPMRIQIPNTEGLPAGTVTDIFCYNHDLEEFASGGTARVSEDGAFIVSDKGSGVIVSGWGDAPPPPPPPTCADGCGECGECKDGACVMDPPLDPVGVEVSRSFGMPSETVTKINEALDKLSSLGILAEVNLLEIEGTVKTKECCSPETGRGHNTEGSVSGNFGGFSVQGKIWPPGPIPTIDVTVAVLGLASLEIKAQFVGGVFLGVAGKVEGEVGYKQDDCSEDAADRAGCFFASLKTQLTFSASAQIGASVEVTTDCIFCVKTTTTAEATFNLGKFSLPFDISNISYNEESCSSGLQGGLFEFEPGTFEVSVEFKGKWEPEGSVSQGFDVTFNFLKCSISLDTGVDCTSAL